MANKSKAAERAKATEPVDYSTISQEPASPKPSREELAKHGYTIPEAWDALENGDPVETADATPLSQINKEADAKQRASLAAAEGHTAPEGASKAYTGVYGSPVPGAKAASGPEENKSAHGGSASHGSTKK